MIISPRDFEKIIIFLLSKTLFFLTKNELFFSPKFTIFLLFFQLGNIIIWTWIIKFVPNLRFQDNGWRNLCGKYGSNLGDVFSPRRYSAERYIVEIYYDQNIGVTFQDLGSLKKCISFRLDSKYLSSSHSYMWIFIKKLEKTFFQYSISIFCHKIAYALDLSTWLS